MAPPSEGGASAASAAFVLGGGGMEFVGRYLATLSVTRIDDPVQSKNVGMILKGISPNALPLFLDWCKGGATFSDAVTRARWADWEPNAAKHTLEALRKLSKADNAEAFKQVKKDESTKHLVEEGKVHIASDENEAWPIFLKMIEADVKKSGGRVFVKLADVWTEDKKKVKAALQSRCISANIKSVTSDGSLRSYSGCLNKANDIIETTLAKMPESPRFAAELWSSSQGYVCFNDGVYDMRAGVFGAYADFPRVMSTIKINRDFPRRDEAKMEEVRERLIRPWFGADERGDTYLAFVARAMSGLVEENKMWGVLMGERDCGKGGSTRMNEEAFGAYVNTINSKSFFMQNAGGDAAKGLSWMLDSEFKRMSYTQEITVDVSNKNVKIDGNAIKGFASGGDSMLARRNFCDEVPFKVQAVLLMCCNDLPPITPNDALENHVMFKCPHKFMAADKMAAEPLPHYMPRDDLVKAYQAQDDVIDAYTWLVLDAFKPHALVMSAIVRADTNRYITNENCDMAVIARRLRFGGGGSDATTAELKEFLKTTGINMSWDKFVDVIEKRGAKYDKNITRDGSRSKRGHKFVEIVGEEEAEEEGV